MKEPFIVCFVCGGEVTPRPIGQPGLVMYTCANHIAMCRELMERTVSNKETIIKNILLREEERLKREAAVAAERHHPECECVKCRPSQSRTIEIKKSVSQ